jgi:hypothetical protein
MLPDSTVQACTFQHGDEKAVKGTKTKLLYHMFSDGEMVVGRKLKYTCGK